MERVLVIRTSAIGDIIMASPMIRVMRRAWPDAYIAWLVEPAIKDLLAEHPMLDEIIPWPKDEWRGLLKRARFLTLAAEINQLARELRQRKFSMVIDAQGLVRTRLLSRLSGAGERIGLDSKEPGRFLMTKIVSRGSHIQHMSSEYFHLMKTLGLHPNAFAPEVYLSDVVRTRALKTLQHANVKNKYIVISPFTTRLQKEWLDARWAHLAQKLHSDLKIPVVMIGGPQDTLHSQQIQNMAGDCLRNLTGRTSLIESAAVVEKSILVIGVDTGLTHMGTAFNRPTLAIFGSTCPYLKTPRDKTIVLYNHLQCAPCRHKPTCNGKFSCMDSISVEQVYQTAHKLLSQQPI